MGKGSGAGIGGAVGGVFGAQTGFIGDRMGSDWFGGISDLGGVSKQARYAQQAAEAEQAQRRAVTAEARAGAQRANLAAQSPQQLAALESGLKAAQTQVDADLRQLAAIDPAIMEASKQVLELLQGKQAAVNDPAMKQRSGQREQLVNSLRAQYGPGAESTSIGQRALQQFDMQSDSMFQTNQQNTLGNLFGMATTRTQGAGFGQLMGVANGYGDYQNRILGAEMGGTQNILQGMTGEVQGAGSEFVGGLIKSGAQRQFMTDIHNDGRQIGRTWATMGAGGKGGAGQAQNTDIGLNGQSQQYRQGNLAFDSQTGQGAFNNNWSFR